MARYPIKMLKDEEGKPFVPLVSTEGIQSPDKRSLSDMLDEKLEVNNIIPGENVIITTEGNDITISTSGKGILIDDLNTATAGIGGLDAHQGKVLKEMIPNIVDDVTSTSTTEALSANQGYVLNQKVVPAGGKAGQVLKKKSDASHSLEWGDAADPNAIVGDGSIKKIIEITYEDYKILEDNGQVDPNTEYHILDSLSVIDNLQETLNNLQSQITSLRDTVQERASQSSPGYTIVDRDGVMEGGKIIDFHSDFTTGNDFDTRLECVGHNKNAVLLPSVDGTLALSGEVLYSNDTGTLDSLTFSKTINNTTYPYLKIFYRNNDKMLGCIDVYNPVGNRVNLVTSDVRSSGANAGRLYIKTSCFDITSTGMNNSSGTFNYGNFSVGSDNVINIDGSVKLIYITKVIAYKNI